MHRLMVHPFIHIPHRNVVLAIEQKIKENLEIPALETAKMNASKNSRAAMFVLRISETNSMEKERGELRG